MRFQPSFSCLEKSGRAAHKDSEESDSAAGSFVAFVAQREGVIGHGYCECVIKNTGVSGFAALLVFLVKKDVLRRYCVHKLLAYF